MMLCVRLLSELKIMLPTHVTNHLTCCNKLWFDLKNMKIQYQKYRKMQFCIQLDIDIWEVILYLPANRYGLKTRNINWCILCSLPQSYCLKQNSKITSNDFDAQSKPYIFKIFFMVILIRLNYFYDSLNIALILAPGREFFCAKCV